MLGLSTQFHATPDELLSFTDVMVREFGLHITAFQFPPFVALGIEPSALGDTFVNGVTYRFALTRAPPVLGAKSSGVFLDQNPGALLLDMGRLSDAGLEESCLSALTDDLEQLKIWKRIAARLKKMTLAGAIAINPNTGATARARARRYSSGAKALQARGVTMRTLGSAVLRFGDGAAQDAVGTDE